MSLSRAVPSHLKCSACRTAIIRSFTTSIYSNGSISPRASRTTSAASPFSRCLTTSQIQRVKRKDWPPPDIEPGFNFLEASNTPSDPQSEPTLDLPPSPQRLELLEAEEPMSGHAIPIPEASKRSSISLEHSPSISSSAAPGSLESTSSSSAHSTLETTQSAPIPWYLEPKHSPSRSETSPEHFAREAIPDLPPNPPPLLKTILEYISITAGLDDLLILDLRHLDPPPALGSKLIMILGTARSEKHLHVSADRFCRYLRREHGLRANAAGLLGRNELKIKLRRKAKRMKMLANIGGQEPEGNIDDGIRTGWICCTVGKIEPHELDIDMPGPMENFVGFRDVKPGVNVVVQMFTEEKRMEIDLETLWGGVLKTNERKDGIAEEKLRELEGVEADDVNDEDVATTQISRTPTARHDVSRAPSDPFPSAQVSQRQWNRPSSTKGDIFPPASNRDTTRQLRRLHTVGLRGAV